MAVIDFRNLEAEVGVTPTGRTPLAIPFLGAVPGSAVEVGTPFTTLEEVNTYYNNGFLPAGGGQIGGGSLLDRITGLAGGILGAITRSGPAPVQISPMSAVPATVSRGAAAVERGMGAVISAAEAHPVLTAAGGAAATVAGGVMGARTMRGRKRPTITQHPDGTIRVRHHRRMNACNIHALRRSIRRLHSFERTVRKVMHFVAPHKTHGHMVFKKKQHKRS